MTTLAYVRSACRLTIAATAIVDATLDGWIADALRFHSVQFPRRARVDLACTAGTQEYALPEDIAGATGGDIYRVLEVGLVQAGEAHPLQLVTPLSPRMFGGGRYCAVVTADIEDTDNEFAILVAELVATGDVLQVTVACSWPIPTVGSDDDVVLVPAGHLEALIAFVEFRVHWALETDEAINLGNVSILLSQLGTEARMAWRRYKEIVERLEAVAPTSSGRVVWGRIGL